MKDASAWRPWLPLVGIGSAVNVLCKRVEAAVHRSSGSPEPSADLREIVALLAQFHQLLIFFLQVLQPSCDQSFGQFRKHAGLKTDVRHVYTDVPRPPLPGELSVRMSVKVDRSV